MDPKMRDRYLEKTRNIISKHGWAVQGVLGSHRDGGGFSYTIGLTQTLKHPEIFMAGFDPDLSKGLLNDVGNLVKNGYDFANPCLCDRVIREFNVAFRPLEPASVKERGGVGTDVLGPFEAVQMFLPDPAGRFPWDEGCDPKYVEMQTSLFKTKGPLPGSEEHRAGLH